MKHLTLLEKKTLEILKWSVERHPCGSYLLIINEKHILQTAKALHLSITFRNFMLGYEYLRKNGYVDIERRNGLDYIKLLKQE